MTRGNVNDLLTANGFAGPIDLLSLDLDGIDYWVWEALDAVQPRVVVVEYQDCLGPDRAWTVPYQDDFSAAHYPTTNPLPNFAGASLAGLREARQSQGLPPGRGQPPGYNAFFVKEAWARRRSPKSTPRRARPSQVVWECASASRP